MSRKKMESEAKFDAFPLEIRLDIFHRLPIKSLIRCTAVRKAWRSVIRNPSFIRTHLRRTMESNDQNDTHLLLIHGFSVKPTYAFYYSDGEDDSDIVAKTLELYSLHYDNPAFGEHCEVEVPSDQLVNECFRVVATCNGLVCLADDLMQYCNTHIYLANPSIRKFVTLPEPNVTYRTHGGYDASIGFAFDAMTSDYKVLRLVTLRDEVEHSQDRTVAEVFSLATGCWSMLSDVTHRFQMDPRTPQAFVNGALHWHAKRWKEHDLYYFILIFDVGRGLLRETMMPESLEGGRPLTLQLSVSGDGKSIALFHLYCSYFCEDPFCDIWVMNDYCIHESWTKLIRLRPQGPEQDGLLLSSLLPRALCFRKSNEVVVFKQSHISSCSRHPSCHGYELFSIDLAKNVIVLGYVDIFITLSILMKRALSCWTWTMQFPTEAKNRSVEQ
uniref:F-box protein CPR30-like n=1 Tax=Fragaria vesca subsp. vesca TaxID=101020 RepID=UPI0005CA6FD4|nr:PREDICTED: F-box protein CPR30-like [Fragaria vesca subsp. vesca]